MTTPTPTTTAKNHLDHTSQSLNQMHNRATPKRTTQEPAAMQVTSTNGTVYETLEEVGRGGSAVVHSAVRVEDGQPVAVKIAHKPRHAALDFANEIRLIGRASHRSLALPTDHGKTSDNRIFTVGRMLHGKDMHKAHKTGSRPGWVPPGLADVCLALDTLHRDATVFHGDVKPENIMTGAQGRMTLCDFGLSSEPFTMGQFCGTPQYAAPECFRGCERVGFSSDIFSVGVICWERLFGREARPDFGWDTDHDEPRINGKQMLPSLDGATEHERRLLAPMLALEPSDRATALEAACLINAFLEKP